MYPASTATRPNPLADAARRRVAQGYGPAAPQAPAGQSMTRPQPVQQRAGSAFTPPAAPMAPSPGAAMPTAPAAPSAMGGAAPAMGLMGAGGPMASPAAQGGGYARDPISTGNPDGKFQVRNPKQWGKYINRLNLRDYFKASGPLWEQIGNLEERANRDAFSDEERAQFLAPTIENIGDQTDLAQGQYDQAMSERGLTDSSANALGQSNILSRAAGARAGAVHDLWNEENASKEDAQAQLMQALGAMSGRGIGNAQQGWGNQQQLQLQRLLAGQQDDGSLFGDLFGGLGAMAGMAGGLGWSPFGSRSR